MKLDKIKFAKLIAFITHSVGTRLSDDDIEHIDHLIDIEITAAKVSCSDVDELLR